MKEITILNYTYKSCQFLKYNTDSDKLLVYYFVINMLSPMMLAYMATMLLMVSCSLGLR